MGGCRRRGLRGDRRLRDGHGRGGRRPQRARRRPARRTRVVPVPRRRLHQPDRPGCPDRRRGRPVATRRGVVPALGDRLLRRPPGHRRVAARPRRLPRRLHLRGGGGARRRRPGPDARRRRAGRPGRVPGPVRALPVGPPAAGVARQLPVAGGLGRPRGREQLRRARAAGPGRPGRVRRPEGRRLPGVVGAHAGAAAGARRWRGVRGISVRALGRSGRRDPARRPPVPQRSGVRWRHHVDRPAVRRGARPRPHDARRGAGGLAGRGAGDARRDVEGARPADRAHRPAAAQRRDRQLRPVGRVRAGPRATARPGAPRPSG